MYNYFKTFIFRTPFFSFSSLPDFKQKLNEPTFKEMLQIATSDLSAEIDKDKDTDKSLYSAYRYFQRACTRSTPFGLFAGCSVGTVSEHTNIRLMEQKKYKRSTRLDMDFFCELTQQIESDRNIREQLCYYPNNSIYPVGKNLRYVAYHYKKTRRVHQIKQIENTEYIQKVLNSAKRGVLFSELATVLVDDEISMEEATGFIYELIDIQAIVSELTPAVTNVQPLTSLIARLKGLPNFDSQIIDVLLEIEAQLIEIDSQSIGSTGHIYPAIIRNIEKMRNETEIKYMFQTDLFKPVQDAYVSQNILKDIQQALIFLNKITLRNTQTNLLQFKDKFIKRYEECEMPLLLVLDNELGIGYGDKTSGDISPLVDDLVVPSGNSLSQGYWSFIQSILLQRYQQSTQETIELTDEDVKGIEAVWDDLPLTFSVICELLQDNEQGRSFYIKMAGGHSATNLLGRFCHLDKQILNHTLAMTEKEAQMNPDVIFAEIVHLPESRVGNILLRPILRPYEIPYLAKTGVSNEFELRPDDLCISIKNNRIILRSKRLNKEIVPRMSSAHNYSNPGSMPIYQFLCDIQHQNGRIGLGFRWNEISQQLDYLPRVIYRNCILSKACWTVREKEVKTLIGITDNSELLLKIKEWQSKRNIPDTVVLADGDNDLYVNMNDSLSIRAWLSVVKKRPYFLLKEFLFDPETAIVHGIEGVFTNEFVFAFYKEENNKKK